MFRFFKKKKKKKVIRDSEFSEQLVRLSPQIPRDKPVIIKIGNKYYRVKELG